MVIKEQSFYIRIFTVKELFCILSGVVDTQTYVIKICIKLNIHIHLYE